MKTKMTFDTLEVQAGLQRLSGELAVSLARSMAVAGGKVLRDEAIKRAPRGESSILANSIYLAYSEGKTTDKNIVYTITWNSRKAPHGHLLEFGHWRYNRSINGVWQRSKSGTGKNSPHDLPGALKTPVWEAAHPFLRPAYESAGQAALAAMYERARVRLPELIAEAKAKK